MLTLLTLFAPRSPFDWLAKLFDALVLLAVCAASVVVGVNVEFPGLGVGLGAGLGLGAGPGLGVVFGIEIGFGIELKFEGLGLEPHATNDNTSRHTAVILYDTSPSRVK